MNDSEGIYKLKIILFIVLTLLETETNSEKPHNIYEYLLCYDIFWYRDQANYPFRNVALIM